MPYNIFFSHLDGPQKAALICATKCSSSAKKSALYKHAHATHKGAKGEIYRPLGRNYYDY